MDKLTVSTVARNYYNLPLWIAQEQNFLPRPVRSR